MSAGTQTQTYRGYGIWVSQDPRGYWYATIRPVEPEYLQDAEPEAVTVGPFLTAEAAWREAQWQIELQAA